jgi:hypothetical protein
MEPIYMKAVFNVIYCIKNGVGLFTIYINPIPAGVLENQDMRPPPSKSHVLCPNMTNDASLESSCALLLESAKKFANLQKLNFLSQNPFI